MSNIDDLIMKMCPDGVEYSTIEYTCSIRIGDRLEKSAMNAGGIYPVYGGGIMSTGRYSKINTPANSITIGRRGTIGYVNFITEDFWGTSNLFIVKPETDKLDVKFAYYAFKIQESKLRKQKKIGGTPAIDKPDIKKIKIPIPPIEVQKEIVNILDKFTQLEAELSAELAAELDARRMQYEYYRSQLLTFGESRESIRWLTLEEVCVTISAGGDLPKNYKKGQSTPTKELPYPIYSNGTEDKALYGFTDGYKIDREAVTISARGTIGYHTVRSPGFTPIVRLVTLIADTNYITSKYLNYALDITKIGHSGGSIPQLTVPNVKKLKVPVPSLAEQSRIVNLLDKLDALTNGISTDFPAEINFRRQQYEYYRTKLLTFQELPV